MVIHAFALGCRTDVRVATCTLVYTVPRKCVNLPVLERVTWLVRNTVTIVPHSPRCHGTNNDDMCLLFQLTLTCIVEPPFFSRFNCALYTLNCSHTIPTTKNTAISYRPPVARGPTSYSPQKSTAASSMSRYFPTPTKAKPRINPLIKLFVWRCSDDGCKYVNETLASERGYVRMISTGEELPEPMWYGEKCEMCRQKAG